MTEFIIVKTSEIAVVTLNRPTVLNAWHAPMRKEIIESLAQLQSAPDVKAIVMTGAGRAFGAGQDLNESKSFSGADVQQWMADWESLYNSVRRSQKPVVMALNGVCVGSAFQLALMADYRIAHAGVKMGQPEINSGVASVIGPWLMREMIGLARSIELTQSGRLPLAEECLALGLISQIVDENAVLQTAIDTARSFAQKPRGIFDLNKQWFLEMTEPGFRSAIAAGVRNQSAALNSGESNKAMEAFLTRKVRTQA